MMTKVGFKETSPGVWRLTFDDAVLGDGKGYSLADAKKAAQKVIAEEWEWATRDGRDVELELDFVLFVD